MERSWRLEAADGGREGRRAKRGALEEHTLQRRAELRAGHEHTTQKASCPPRPEETARIVTQSKPHFILRSQGRVSISMLCAPRLPGSPAPRLPGSWRTGPPSLHPLLRSVTHEVHSTFQIQNIAHASCTVPQRSPKQQMSERHVSRPGVFLRENPHTDPEGRPQEAMEPRVPYKRRLAVQGLPAAGTPGSASGPGSGDHRWLCGASARGAR
ncbi:uncharacterized protein [Dipodomys merriami]|uniref:uncharacterized protein n=1 Tax=Dipodomys merriami TaxID=94247 RepID=UPI00384BB242